MKIELIRGSFDETCSIEKNLIENQIEFPEIRDVIQYSEQRMISTLIVAGATAPYQTAAGNMSLQTKIGTIPKDKLIGNAGYRYRVQGRIQKSSVINHQIGSSGADGTFQLSMKDNYLVPGMNAVFHGQRLEARTMSAPTGGPGNFVYEFQTTDGTVFDYAVHVAPQQGEKTAFGGYTSYGEKSLRGHSRSHYPDMFINHTTTQRKSLAISGATASTVIWLQFNGVKGWMFEKQRQSRVQFMLEDEHQKFWGKSSMRNADGTLRSSSRLIDSETGLEIIQGDGIWEQCSGKNDAFTSGVNGKPTYDDFRDMMSVMKLKANQTTGNRWYAITGPDGMSNAQDVLSQRAVQNMNITLNKDGSNKIGGQDVEVGYNFTTLNIDGNQVIFVEHPLFGDEQRFTERAVDGELAMSSTYLFMNSATSDTGMPNIEILGRGAYGNNRSMVSGSIHGMSGVMNKLGVPVTSAVDADEFHMLKEDNIFLYDTSSCGILHRTTS